MEKRSTSVTILDGAAKECRVDTCGMAVFLKTSGEGPLQILIIPV
jgi:hypothetical protein